MQDAPEFPLVEELLPHRGTMLLVDRVCDFSDDSALVEFTPRADGWYADESGAMSAWIGIELMAQAIAVHVALDKRRYGLPVKMGALLGTRSYRPSQPVFAADQPLLIRAKMLLRDESGMGAYACSIESAGQCLALATLKVYELEDFRRFVQGK